MTNEEILNESEIKFLIDSLHEDAEYIRTASSELVNALTSDESLDELDLSDYKKAMIRMMKFVSPKAFNSAIAEFEESSNKKDTIRLQIISNIITKLSLQKSLL